MSKVIWWGQPNQTNVVRPGEAIVPQKGTGSAAPVFISTIPDLNLTQNVLMTPYDTSIHFKGADTYAITALNAGLAFDTATGIISGTPTSLDSFNPIISANNVYGSVDALSFNIGVTI